MIPRSLVVFLGSVLVIVGILEIGAGLAEVVITRSAIMFNAGDVLGGERVILFAAYVRAVSDGLWTIGFGGLVAIAGAFAAKREVI